MTNIFQFLLINHFQPFLNINDPFHNVVYFDNSKSSLKLQTIYYKLNQMNLK